MRFHKIFTLVAAAASVLFINSCERMEQTTVCDTDGHVLIPFSAETDASTTKAQMNGNSTSNIVYSEGDKLIVYSGSMNCPVLPSMMNLVSGAGTKKGTFKGDIVLREGKTKADFNTWITKYPDTIQAIIIPAAGLEAGLFTWDASKHDLSINFTSNAMDCDLEALVKRTVLFFGEIDYANKKVTSLTMGTSYVKSTVTVPSEADWNAAGKDYNITLRYDGVYGGYPFLTPTAKLVGTRGTSDPIWSGWSNTETYEATGSFSLSSSTGGTLYLALLAALDLRANSDEYEAGDKQSFTLTMENVGKGYSLYDGKIEAFAIERGKGFSKAVTMSEPSAEDILVNQPESVRTVIMTTKGADLNRDGRLTRYEAAQFSPSGRNKLGLMNNIDLTNANFFQFFTRITDTDGDLFRGCSKLTSVCFPKSLEIIGQYTFAGCSSLKTVLWGNSRVTSVGGYAFIRCTSLTSVTLPETLTTLSGGVFEDCSALTFADLATTSVTTLMTGTFRGCTALKTVNLTIDLTSIGIEAFKNCTKLASISLPAALTRIRDGAFSGCTSLATINLEETKVASIENYAFSSCSALTHLTFPATLSEFGNDPVNDSALASIRFKGNTPPANIKNVCLDQIKKIYVPSAALEAYKTVIKNAKGSDYSSRVVAG